MSARAWLREHVCVPWPLLALYCLGALAESFPLTAYSGWLNDDLRMPQSAQSDFYSVVFFPFLLKPAFGLLSDRVPLRGRHRQPWLVLCYIGAAAAYALTALVVNSTALAFAVTLLRTFCEAFAELLLGASLMDVARRRSGTLVNPAALQAAATGARYAGTLLAYLFGLAVYRCQAASDTLSNRAVIGLTGAAHVLALGCVAFLEEAPRPAAHAAHEYMSPRVLVLVALLQLLFLGMGLRSLLPPLVWRVGLSSVAGLIVLLWAACWAGPYLRQQWRRRRQPPSLARELPVNSEEAVPLLAPPPTRFSPAPADMPADIPAAAECGDVPSPRKLVLAGVLLFLLNAVPTADLQVSNFTYEIFAAKLCYLQYLGLLGGVTSLAASVVYGVALQRRHVSFALMLTAIFAALSSLVALPLVRLADPAAHLATAFGYACLSTVVTVFFGELALLPALVLATEHTPRAHAGTVYGTFLAVLDFGDTAAGLVTAPIVSSLHISPTNWSGLPALVVITATARVATLVLVPLWQRAVSRA